MVNFQGGTNAQKGSGESLVGITAETWNVADGFTKIKILKILIELDLFETMAMYGKQNIEDELPYTEIPYRRVEGLDRLVFSLRQVVGNCKFAIKQKHDKDVLNILLSRIDAVENVMDGVATVCFNDITKENELRINEDHFKKCFTILRDIKNEVNDLLNRAGLIFRKTDEVDIDSIMKSIYEG